MPEITPSYISGYTNNTKWVEKKPDVDSLEECRTYCSGANFSVWNPKMGTAWNTDVPSGDGSCACIYETTIKASDVVDNPNTRIFMNDEVLLPRP